MDEPELEYVGFWPRVVVRSQARGPTSVTFKSGKQAVARGLGRAD